MPRRPSPLLHLGLLAASLAPGCGEAPARVASPPAVATSTARPAATSWAFPFPPDVGPRTRTRLNDLQATRVDELGEVVRDADPAATGVLTDGDPAAADALREGLPEAATLEAWLVEGGDPAALPEHFVKELDRTDELLRVMRLPTLFSPLLRLRPRDPDTSVEPESLISLQAQLGPRAETHLARLRGARGMTRVVMESLDEAALVLQGRKRVFEESPGKAAVKPSATMWGFRQSVIEAQLSGAERARLSTWFREARDSLRLTLAAAGRVLTDPNTSHGPALVDLIVEALDRDLFLLLFTELAERPVEELLGSAAARAGACTPAGFLRVVLTRYQWFVAQTRVVGAARRRTWIERLAAHRRAASACLPVTPPGAWALRGIRRTHPGEGLFSDLEGHLAEVLSAPPDDDALAQHMARAAYFRVQDTSQTWGLVKQLARRIRERGLEAAALREFLALPEGAAAPTWLMPEWRRLLAQLEGRGY